MNAKLHILISGGSVVGILADQPGIEVEVLDADAAAIGSANPEDPDAGRQTLLARWEWLALNPASHRVL